METYRYDVLGEIELVGEHGHIIDDDRNNLMHRLAENPIHGFQLMRRFTDDWLALEKDIMWDGSKGE